MGGGTLKTVGVLSLLEGTLLAEARRLWKLFETEYGSTGAQAFDYPNLTFQGGICDDVEGLAGALAGMCQQTAPVEIIVDGLGYFETPAPTVYLKVQRTEELQHINRAVNAVLSATCVHVAEYYLPERWVPHVTLAMGDLTPHDLERSRQDLRQYHPRYQQVISSLQLVQRHEPTGRIEIVQGYPLCLGGG